MATKKSTGGTRRAPAKKPAAKKTAPPPVPPPNPMSPMIDVSQWFRQFEIPGVDVESLMENSRKDWEALQQSMQKAASGWQTLAEKQNELMQAAIRDWQNDLAESVGRSPEENMRRFRERMETGIAEMRELAEMVTQSQAEAGEILRKRFEENIKRLTGG